jgi:hypothetical protein
VPQLPQDDDAKILELLAAILDKGLSGAGVSGTTETVLFYFTANGQQQYACQYDGRIIQGGSTSNGNCGISVNTDLPIATISVQSVYQGQNVALWPTATGSNQLYILSHPFKTGDVIKVRNYNASTNSLQLVLQRV